MIRQMNSLITLYGKKEGFEKAWLLDRYSQGKRASMMGVSGSILNHKTRIIVLLSGTKTALWHQTLLRFYKDLDNNDNQIIKRKTEKIIPPPSIVSNANSQIEEMYSSQERPIVNALNDENKVLIFLLFLKFTSTSIMLPQLLKILYSIIV